MSGDVARVRKRELTHSHLDRDETTGVYTMQRRRNDALLDALSLHVACGGRIKPWAAENGVHERTVRLWANLPEVKERIANHRREITDRLLGKHYALVDRAMRNIAKMMDHAETEPVKYAANRNIIADLVSVARFADIDLRLKALEGWQNGDREPGRGETAA